MQPHPVKWPLSVELYVGKFPLIFYSTNANLAIQLRYIAIKLNASG